MTSLNESIELETVIKDEPQTEDEEIQSPSTKSRKKKKKDTGFIKCSRCHLRISNHDSTLGEHESVCVLRGEDNETCGVCAKRFSKPENCTRHIRVFHLKICPYSCDLCGKAFGDKRNWERHVAKRSCQTRNVNNKLKCKACGTKFKSQEGMSNHFCSGENYPRCKLCMKRVYKAALAIHEKICSFKGTSAKDCGVCGEQFERVDEASKHIRIIHLGLPPVRCKICSLTFGEKIELSRHMSKKSCQPSDFSEELLENSVNDWTSSDPLVDCPNEIKQEPIVDEPPHHMPVHDNLMELNNVSAEIKTEVSEESIDKDAPTLGAIKSEHCTHCDKFFTPSNIKSHVEICALKDHNGLGCAVCGKTFAKPENCTRHIRVTHFNILPFECQFCLKKFSERRNLNVHRCSFGEDFRGSKNPPKVKEELEPSPQEAEVPQKFQKCLNCLKHFPISNFEAHVEVCALKGTSGSVCGICGKEFSKPENCSRHIRISHLNILPFECHLCGKKFGEKRSMQTHIDRQACLKKQERLETPYWVCTHKNCGKRFTDEFKLAAHEARCNAHLRQTKNIEYGRCKFCAKKLRIGDSLESHESICHLKGDNPTDCTLCGKKFARPENATRHIKTAHFQEKRFECEFCHAKFGEKGNLTKHLQKKVCQSSSDNHLRCLKKCGKSFRDETELALHEENCIGKGPKGKRPSKKGLEEPHENLLPLPEGLLPLPESLLTNPVIESDSNPTSAALNSGN